MVCLCVVIIFIEQPISMNSQLPRINKKVDFIKNVLAWKLKTTTQNNILWKLVASQDNQRYSHQWFNTQLRLSNVCDIEQVQVPGSIILLPWGLKICERFVQLVREEAAQLDYEEYSYPKIIPKHYFNPMKEFIDLKTSLLYLDKNFALSPTGEYAVYSHWHSQIKTEQDLPKKIFQHTTYFRPMSSSKRSGGSVFLSMEANDVFEFHACFAEKEAAINEASQLRSFYEKIAEKTGTFVLWSLRPSWRNHGDLYEWSYGGDAIIPSGYSVQISCAYFQGNVFSKPFDIAFGKPKKWTSQATGAISRRLVFANLFQSMRSDGSLCLHPHLAPVQILILLTSNNTEDEMFAHQLLEILVKKNIRVDFKKVHQKRDLLRENKRWHQWGIPLKLMILSKEKHQNKRIILVRNDTQEEITDICNEQASEIISLALTDIINHHKNLLFQKKITECETLDSVRCCLEQHQSIALPLVMKPETVAQIEMLKKGEVLGFFWDEKPLKCLITQQETHERAWVSRRI